MTVLPTTSTIAVIGESLNFTKKLEIEPFVN